MDKEYRCKYCGAKAGKHQKLCCKCYEKRRYVRKLIQAGKELKQILERKRNG